MAAKTCDLCPRRADSPIQGLCTKCYDYSGWENSHQDESHDHYFAADASDETKAEAATLIAEGKMYSQEECLICNGTPDPATVEIVKGHSNGIKKSHTSHAACKHPSTKKDRAICRKNRAAE